MTLMLQPTNHITQACNEQRCHWKTSAGKKWFKSGATLLSASSCHRMPPTPSQAPPRWPAALTWKQVSRSSLGRPRTCRSSGTCPWTSRPGTSRWPGTSRLCGAPARRSSEACRRTGPGSCGERSHTKKAHSWCQPHLDSSPMEQKASRNTARKERGKRDRVQLKPNTATKHHSRI